MTFHLGEGRRLKNEGIGKAARRRENILWAAREIARGVARTHGTVTADDVQARMILMGYPPLGNTAGAIFRSSEYEFTGEWRQSARVSNHARMNRVWRLKQI